MVNRENFGFWFLNGCNEHNDNIIHIWYVERITGLAVCTTCTTLYWQYIQNVLHKKSVLHGTDSKFNVY